MSVREMDELSQLFKDARATPTERSTVLADFQQNPSLTGMPPKSTKLLSQLRKRQAENRPDRKA